MEWLFILVLILVNGLFSMSEIALVSSRKIRLPKVGEKIVWRGFEFEVLDLDNIKIDKILVSRH